MISLNGVDYIHFGKGTPQWHEYARRRLGGERGLSVAIGAGEDPTDADSYSIALNSTGNFEGSVEFSVLGHVLPALPNIKAVQWLVGVAAAASRSFLVLRQPWCDSDGELFAQGLKLWSSDRGINKLPLTSFQLYKVLEALRREKVIARFALLGADRISDTANSGILPLNAPVGARDYEPGQGAKQVVPLQNTFGELIAVVAVRQDEVLDKIRAKLPRTELIFDSGLKGRPEIPVQPAEQPAEQPAQDIIAALDRALESRGRPHFLPTVAPLGSCRIWTPLKLADGRGELVFRPNKAFGYVHNVPEMKQIVDILKAERPLPPELYGLLNVVGAQSEIAERKPLFREMYAGVDVCVVEVSSVRLIEYKGYQLQQHRFREQFPGEEGDLVSRIYRAPAADRSRLVEEFIGRHPELASEKSALLRESVFSEQDANALYQSIEDLYREVGGRMFFVGFMVIDNEGKIIPQRERIRECLTRFVSNHPGTGFFDPTPYVEAAGHDTALIDLGHYRPEFEEVMSKALSLELARYWDTVSASLEPA